MFPFLKAVKRLIVTIVTYLSSVINNTVLRFVTLKQYDSAFLAGLYQLRFLNQCTLK